MSSNPVGKETEIRRCCEKVLESPGFRESPRIRSFLRYVVDLSLSGRQSEIKEYAIGVDVFERGAGFDSKRDPIVRVQAGRLRLKLAEYYREYGAEDPIRIELPKGCYIPIFHLAGLEKRESPQGQGGLTIPGAAEGTERVRWSGIPLRFVRRAAIPLAAAALLLTLVLSGDWRRSLPGGPATQRNLRRLTFDWATMPSVSPDGKLVVYASHKAGQGGTDLWLQEVAGGQPVQLTKLPEMEWTPSFSPDGKKVLFWYSSIRPGASREEGLYIVPVDGGEPRKILGGYTGNPRLSPDGQWIAYTGRERGRHALFLVASAGGTPKQLAPGLFDSAFPSWSPDGRHIIFLGTAPGQESLLERRDWWVVPAQGGTPVRTGAVRRMVDQGVIARDEDTEFVWPSAWYRDRIVFRGGRSDDSIHVWTLGLNPGTFAPAEKAIQVTFGGAREALPAASNEGTLVFCGQRLEYSFWSVSLDANAGKTHSLGLRKIEGVTASDGIGAMGRDGGWLVFQSVFDGNTDIRRFSPISNSGMTVVGTAAQEYLLATNDDASKVLYRVLEGKTAAIYAGSLEDRKMQRVCTQCSAMLSPDGGKVYYSTTDPNGEVREVRVLGLQTGKHGASFTVDKGICFPCTASRFSLDGRWAASLLTLKPGDSVIALHTVPDGTDKPVEIVATIGGPGDGYAYWSRALSLMDWSPDGHLLYFASDRDRYRCIWAQRLEPHTKRPRGEPFAVLHNHRPGSHLLRSVSVTRSQLVLGLSEGLRACHKTSRSTYVRRGSML